MKSVVALVLAVVLVASGCWTQTNADGSPKKWRCGTLTIQADNDTAFRFNILAAAADVTAHTGRTFAYNDSGPADIYMHNYWVPGDPVVAAGYSDNADINGTYWKATSWTGALATPYTQEQLLVTMSGVIPAEGPVVVEQEWADLRSITC